MAKKTSLKLGTVSDEEIAILKEANLDFCVELLNWNDWLELVNDYMNKNKVTSVPESYVFDKQYRVGKWFKRNRSNLSITEESSKIIVKHKDSIPKRNEYSKLNGNSLIEYNKIKYTLKDFSYLTKKSHGEIKNLLEKGYSTKRIAIMSRENIMKNELSLCMKKINQTYEIDDTLAQVLDVLNRTKKYITDNDSALKELNSKLEEESQSNTKYLSTIIKLEDEKKALKAKCYDVYNEYIALLSDTVKKEKEELEKENTKLELKKYIESVIQCRKKTLSDIGLKIENITVSVTDSYDMLKGKIRGEIKFLGGRHSLDQNCILKAVLYNEKNEKEISGVHLISKDFSGYDVFEFEWIGGSVDIWKKKMAKVELSIV